jgi:iron complex outermembrane receptor protein
MLRIFDLSEFVTMLIGNEKKIFTLSADQTLSDTTTLFGDFLFARTNTAWQLNAQPLTITLAADDPANILGQPVSVRNRFVEHPRRYISDTESMRVVGGVKGRFDDRWSWETALNYSQAQQDFANAGLVRTAAREAAVAAGEIDLFAREQPPAALARIFDEASGEFTSELISWDAKFVGADVLQAPGGGVAMAAGFEAREERLEATSEPDSQSATFAYDSGATIDPFSEKRRIVSVFAEMRVPMIGPGNRLPWVHAADLTMAARHERYNDTDDPTVPKISLRYQPVGEDLLLRFTFSKSFAAPTLYELNSPTGIGFTGPLPEFDSNQAHLRLEPVESLSPSRSTNYSAGLVWTPGGIGGLSLSIDYFNIEQTAVVGSLNDPGVLDQVFRDVELQGGASPYAGLIRSGSFEGPAITEPGQVSELGLDNLYFVIPSSSNLGTQKLDGADITIAYERPLPDGKIRWDSTTTYYRGFQVQVAPGAPFTQTAGRVTGLNGSIPRWRSYNALTYSWRNFTVDVAHTYYSPMRDTGWSPAWLPDYQERIPSYSVFDARVTCTFSGERRWFKRLQVTVGVNNIANRMPSRSATYDSLSNADVDEFNPVGRLFYVSARYRF